MVANPALLKKTYSFIFFILTQAVTHCFCLGLYTSTPYSHALMIWSLHLNAMLDPPQRLSGSTYTFPVRQMTLSTEFRQTDSSSRSACPYPPKIQISPFLSWQRVWLLRGITLAKSFLVTCDLMLYFMKRGLFDLPFNSTNPPER